MKITVITTCFNSAATIGDTLESVKRQDYPALEYIVVDGGSSDGTLDVVSCYSDVVNRVIYGPDSGIYDALNKGIDAATGDVVGFLHSDDFFAHSAVLSQLAAAFQSSGADAVYADLDYVDRNDPQRVIRKWRSQPYSPALFYRGWMPAHPTFYLKRSLYMAHGGYKLQFKQSADYELMLRMLLRHGCSAHYLPEVIVKMRVGGASNVSLKNRWRANREDAMAWKVNALRPALLTRWLKPLSKLFQFLR